MMDVKYELDNLRQDFFLEENEDNWEKITKAMASFIRVGEQGGYESSPSEAVNALRSYHRPMISAMNSERTRLSGAALDLLGSAATGLGAAFEPLLSLFMSPLLALCARTNKVVINRARTVIFILIESSQLVSVLSYFLQNIKDKSASLRMVVAEGTLACLNSCNPPDLEKEARAREVEAIIRGTARDANADVRKVSRKVFESYKILLPNRVDNFTGPLTPTMKKYLDIKTGGTSSIASSTSSRNNLNLKPTVKPSTSASASTSTMARNNVHMRSASTSTMLPPSAAQSRNLATSLTRVSRKEPKAGPSVPPMAARPIQPTRVVSESQPSNPQRATARVMRPAVEEKNAAAPVPPLRTQKSIVSRTASTTVPTTAPHRVVPKAGPTPDLAASHNSQQPGSSGPRRVPIPPPAPPAEAKQKERAKPPISRPEKAPGSQRQPVAPVPVKKPTIASSTLRERNPPAKGPTPTSIPASKAKSTSKVPTTASTTTATTTNKGTITTATTTMKPKPLWGRSAPPAKPTAASTQRAASKTVVKKPSTRLGPASKMRPVTPAMVALPPSPTPSGPKDEEEAGNREKAEEPEEAPVTLIEPSPSSNDREEPAVQELAEEEAVEEESETESVVSTPEESEPAYANIDDVEQQTEKTLRPAAFGIPASQNLGTPQGFLLQPANGNPVALSTKTPISALLFSIERGFMYSPNSPLSPPDGYANGAIPVHSPPSGDPMRAFNHALHTPSLTYGKREQQRELVRGDIGVVSVDSTKLFTPSSLNLEDGMRTAFIEINQ